MIAILNLLPVLFFFAMVCWAKARYSKSKSIKSIYIPSGSFLIVFFLYFQIQPSYMPKGGIARTQVPIIESHGELKDLQPKPMDPEERDKKRMDKYKEKLPFVEDNQ